jgi:hypothetical protein
MPYYEKGDDGMQRDKAAMDAAREAVKGRGDGRISIADVSRRTRATSNTGRACPQQHAQQLASMSEAPTGSGMYTLHAPRATHGRAYPLSDRPAGVEHSR